MKKICLLIVFIFLSIFSFSDFKITRGPNVGEIYYVGPTYNGIGLYYSTDHGNTAICKDSITNYGNICADLTSGFIYYRDLPGNIFFSENYGEYGSWEFRNSNIKQQINSGRIEGEIFSSFSKHSDDYAQTFINHSCNGYFGNRKDIDLDPIIIDVGYVISYDPNVLDTLYMFISSDKFENLQIVKKFNFIWNEAIELTRGTNSGEIYLCNHTREFLLLSTDYANTWININNFNFGDFYSIGIVGGRTDGELYIKCDYVNMAWQNANTYILYSNDYGISFEFFHPFSKGQEPLLANFSAKEVENENLTLTDYDSIYFVTGEMPLDVQFYNYSIGDVISYEWDFDNDGLVDSYEQIPVFTYADTGWYSVNLTVFDGDDTNSFLRENYIYVDKTTGMEKKEKPKINCYPNPFTEYITILLSLENNTKTNILEIYDISGKPIRTMKTNENIITWNGKNNSGQKCESGIYFLKLKDYNISKKILLTN